MMYRSLTAAAAFTVFGALGASNVLAQGISANDMCEAQEAFEVCVKTPEAKEFVRAISVVQTTGLQQSDIAVERTVECFNVSLVASGFMEMQRRHFTFDEYVKSVATKDAYDYAWKVKANNVKDQPPLYSDDVMRAYFKDPARLQKDWMSCLSEATNAAKESLGAKDDGAGE